MNSRQRAINTFTFNKVDRSAVQYYYSPVGYYEHGEKLNDLYEKHPGDFCEFERQPIPVLPPENFDENGRYHVFEKDDWGTTWEYRIFGIMGHATQFPIKSLNDMVNYSFPPLPDYVKNTRALNKLKTEFNEIKKDYFVMPGIGGAYLERLSAIRGFDEFLMDLYDDTSEINSLMDRLTDYYLGHILALIKAGVDGITFGDDYGTQQSLILSKDMFRHAIKPRLKKLMTPIKEAGLHVHFHSCGFILDLFDDFKDIGVDSIWPQMPLYDMKELRDACREYNFSIALHPDRAVTMTHGSPDDVRALVYEINDVFKPKDGGSWFYIETDTGFPFENIKTLVETIYSL